MKLKKLEKALVRPQPQHSTPNKLLNKHSDPISSTTLAGMTINRAGTIKKNANLA
ncbi:hypothetical protein PRVXT_000912 [Proteinivorax tanatarense]|uniref:Uncharacterized protein n=1 Tax=Proteinivorax tanatarense TaxID=1260629 RepID=A0AAU7VNV7_9FIRM